MKLIDAGDNELKVYDYTANGETLELRSFLVDSADVSKVLITPAEPNVFDWFSITEVYMLPPGQTFGV